MMQESKGQDSKRQYYEIKKIVRIGLLFILISLLFNSRLSNLGQNIQDLFASLLLRVRSFDTASPELDPSPRFSEPDFDGIDVHEIDIKRVVLFLIACFAFTIPFIF
ncbi:hypothetical protein RNJ44_04365 [Nakaseomyces bracarensis]|uniref:Uncharacterized protein n=1 Tax=Nakaseomyces bracarensis TaxID=273131 RepID=A0ABR4NUP4_9SACH